MSKYKRKGNEKKIKITKKYSCCDYRLTDLSTGDRQGVIYRKILL
ncbi:hypothetical protein [Clostridium sp.]